MIPTIISGLLSGGLYALLALAVVLVFRTTGVANFAQGEMGMFTVFVFLMVIIPIGLPIWLSWIAAILAGGLIAAGIFLVLMRPRSAAGHLNLTIRTVGLYSLISSVAVFLWGGLEPYRLPHMFPAATMSLAGLTVSYDQLGTLGVVVLATAGLLVVFRYTELGLAMRACALDPEVASLLGINVRRMTMVVWAIAGMLGAIAALLTTSISFLETASMRPTIVKALTAATIGGLQSFTGAILGGFLLGAVEALASALLPIYLHEPLVFVILLAVLLCRPAGLFGRERTIRV